LFPALRRQNLIPQEEEKKKEQVQEDEVGRGCVVDMLQQFQLSSAMPITMSINFNASTFNRFGTQT
jgi:hypothetical protein